MNEYEFNVHVTECACVTVKADSLREAEARIVELFKGNEHGEWEFEYERASIYGEDGYVWDDSSWC